MTRPLRTSLRWGCRGGLLGLPSAAAAPFTSVTNARDGTVPAALAAQRIALRVTPRKRRAVERQRRRVCRALASRGLDAALAVRTTLAAVLEDRADLLDVATWRQAQEA